MDRPTLAAAVIQFLSGTGTYHDVSSEIIKKFQLLPLSDEEADRIMPESLKIALGCDHGGFPLKNRIREVIEAESHIVIDCGTDSNCSVDYPDYALEVAKAMGCADDERGILLCGSGIGISVAANKIPGIRAGVCHDTYSAHQGVEHDDMNVLCLGARIVGEELAVEIVRAFLSARFTQEERHVRRLNKVLEIERAALAGEFSSRGAR